MPTFAADVACPFNFPDHHFRAVIDAPAGLFLLDYFRPFWRRLFSRPPCRSLGKDWRVNGRRVGLLLGL